MKKRVLVIAPHPDDDIIGCGGSIVNHISNRSNVYIAYVTNGDASNQAYFPEEFRKLRQKETLKAAEILGVESQNIFFLEESVWNIRTNECRLKLLKLIRKLKPNICYIPHANDAHVDHKIVHQAATEAINMASGPWFKEYEKKENSWEVPVVLSYEVWTPLGEFSYTADISGFMDKKLSALREHKSQIAYTKYDEAVEGLNRYRGIMTGKGKYCECFKVEKITRPL